MELKSIDEYLVLTRGNITKAAMRLNVNRGTLRRYVEGKLSGVVVIEDDGSERLYGRIGDHYKGNELK